MPNLKSVQIADSVTGIGNFAFKECPSLTSITFGSGLKKTGTDVFLRCTALKKLVLPNCDVDYGNNMFLGCTSLTDVTIPAAQTVIGENMFEDCINLAEITLPNSIVEVGSSAFENTGLKQIRIPDSVTTIGHYVFQSCQGLKEITVPGNVKKLGHGVFAYCRNLEKVTLSEDLEEVGDYLIQNSSKVTEITIPSTVANLSNAFGYAYGLKEIHFKGDYPTCYPDLFTICNLTAYYPDGNETWTRDVLKDYGGNVTWKTIHVHKYAATVTDPTCTQQGYTTYQCIKCPDSYIDSYVTALGHAWEDVTSEVKTCTVCDLQFRGNRISLTGEGLDQVASVSVDGVEYPLEKDADGYYVNLDRTDATNLVVYTYNDPNAEDIHTQYPVGMKVWILKYENEAYSATYVPELDDLLQYSGSSIRITGTKGIRMITSLTKDKKAALTGKGLAGYTLVEYGTALCFAKEIQPGDALVLGRDFTRSNYAYKKDEADPIFATTKDLVQYTNVLVGFNLDQCKDDIAMRPYIILTVADGNQITLYGGTIYRSIGYIAYQNRSVFKPKTSSYDYVWEIIHHVYNDLHDADYQG